MVKLGQSLKRLIDIWESLVKYYVYRLSQKSPAKTPKKKKKALNYCIESANHEETSQKLDSIKLMAY